MKKLAFITLLTVVVYSCNKEEADPDFSIDWKVLEKAVIEKDNTIVNQEISKLLENTNPQPTNSDLIGQKFHIENLIKEINKSKVLKAELICYACIETLPAQTEIKITTQSLIVRIIDISTPKDSILKYANIHD